MSTAAAIDPDWRAGALCTQVDSTIFFPAKGNSSRDAKRVCALCEVATDCLLEALANDDRYGIRGGFSERDRRRIQLGTLSITTRPDLTYDPAKYTDPDGHGFRGYKRGCVCGRCRAGYAKYQRDYQRRSGLRVDRNCQQCGHILNGSGRIKYCSDHCKKLAKHARMSGVDKVTVLPTRTVERECAVCGKPFMGGLRAMYCSPSHRVKACRDRKKAAA